MPTPYSAVADAFLLKVTEYKLLMLAEKIRDDILYSHMKASCSDLRRLAYNTTKIDLNERDEETMEFASELPLDIVDLIADGMVLRWLKPYTYSAENLENALNTKDLQQYSPANLLREITAAYKMCCEEYRINKIAFSYNNGSAEDVRRW